jgi:hypothetical protein
VNALMFDLDFTGWAGFMRRSWRRAEVVAWLLGACSEQHGDQDDIDSTLNHFEHFYFSLYFRWYKIVVRKPGSIEWLLSPSTLFCGSLAVNHRKGNLLRFRSDPTVCRLARITLSRQR